MDFTKSVKIFYDFRKNGIIFVSGLIKQIN